MRVCVNVLGIDEDGLKAKDGKREMEREREWGKQMIGKRREK